MTSGSLSDWALHPDWVHLNHGSYGARSNLILQAKRSYQHLLETNPTRCIVEVAPERIAVARQRWAGTMGADPDGFVLTRSVTSGLVAMLRAVLPTAQPGARLLLTSDTYGSVRSNAETLAAEYEVIVDTVPVPATPSGPGDLTRAVAEHVTPNTCAVILDHVTSRTGMVWPIEDIVDALGSNTVVIIDGAHGPGMLNLDLGRLQDVCYAGAGYKWQCGPLGSAFLSVPEAWRGLLRPTTLGHARPGSGAGALHGMFDHPATMDPSPWMVIPDVLDMVSDLSFDRSPGALPMLLRNRAREISRYLTRQWRTEQVLPQSLVAAMVLVQLPSGLRRVPAHLLDARLRRDQIEAKFTHHLGETMLRVSAHVYVDDDHVERFADTVTAVAHEGL